MEKHSLIERIEINPSIMLGKPVIKGTRLPVSIIVEKIDYGATIEDILTQYPFLKKNDITDVKLITLEESSFGWKFDWKNQEDGIHYPLNTLK